MVERQAVDPEAERDLIGSLLLQPERYWEVIEDVGAANFLDQHARAVFLTIGEMLGEGTAVDLCTVRDYLRDKGRAPTGPEASALLNFLVDRYTSRVPHGAAALTLARTVRAQSLRRQIRVELGAAMEDLETGEPSEKLGSLIGRLGGLIEPTRETKVVTIGEAALAAVEAREDADRAYLSTGYPDVDREIHGFRRGELVVIAGRPYVGKTTFTLGLVHRMAVVVGCKTHFVSLEMSADAIGETALLFSSGLTGAAFRSATDLDHLRQLASAKLGTVPITIERRYRLTADDVPALLRRARSQHGADIIVIDNLHLMEHEGARRTGNRVQELAAITRALKNGAAETGTVVIAISHLNRAADLRDDHRPVLADLRDSGTIEQDAALVAKLHMHDYYQTLRAAAPPPANARADLIVRKRRGGSPATVPFLFFPADCSFRPMSTAAPEGG